VLIADALITAGLAALGFGLGVRLPIVMAGPVTVLGSYVLMVVPLVLEPSWLRQISGMWTSCCFIDTDLDPRAVAATSLIGIGLLVAAVMLVSPQLALWTAGLAALGAVMIAFALAGLAVNRDSYTAMVPRVGELQCAGTAPQVCVWPEHGDDLSTLAGLTPQVTSAAVQLGLTVPTVMSEQSPTATGLGYFLDHPSLSKRARIEALAAALFPMTDSCIAQTQQYADPNVTSRFLTAQDSAVQALGNRALQPATPATPPPEQERWRSIQEASVHCDPARLP